jgi:hypothetical protein
MSQPYAAGFAVTRLKAETFSGGTGLGPVVLKTALNSGLRLQPSLRAGGSPT